MGWLNSWYVSPSIKIILPRQPGWLSSTMLAIKALYPPLIRVEEKEEEKRRPGAYPRGVSPHGLPFASFRNDMKYRTNNKKGKTRRSCHREISAGGTVTTYTAPYSSGSLGRRPLSVHGWIPSHTNPLPCLTLWVVNYHSVGSGVFSRIIKLRCLKSDDNFVLASFLY